MQIDLTQESWLTRLVLLIWANGSGKSSIMDVFQSLHDYHSKGRTPDVTYIGKSNEFNISARTDQWDIILNTSPIERNNLAKKFYTRPSVRVVPEIKQWAEKRDDSVRRSIDFERRFDNDVFRYIQIMTSKLWQIYNGDQEIQKKVQDTYITPFNASLKRIFWLEDSLLLQFTWSFSVWWPSTPPNLIFKKWISQEINFSHLSHGEKQVVIILLNFIMRKEELKDKVIYIDEMDVHLHTSLQYNLIQEIVDHRLPSNSQLWTASHSLWFIEYAKNTKEAVIIDFDHLNFDESHVLTPEQSELVYDIAVPQSMLSTVFAGKEIILCENKNSVLFTYLDRENTVFVPANNKAWVLNQAIGNQLKWIIDRDYLTDTERLLVQDSFGVVVLEYYCLENYLYHPNNLEEYYAIRWKDYNKEWYIKWLVDEKNNYKEHIKMSKVKSSRDGYLVFKQTYIHNVARSQENEIGEHLDSDTIEIFFKSFSLKDYAKQLTARQHISQHNLMKTDRIKNKINWLLN